MLPPRARALVELNPRHPWATRDAEETEGPWIKLKKNKLPGLAVLAPAALSDSARTVLADAYDELADADLLPLARLDEDPVRVRIDEAIAEAIGSHLTRSRL